MANPTEANPFSNLPAEAWQHILTHVGNPPVTSRVSRAWKEQTKAVLNSELRSVFHYLNP
ncbi:MAG: F-box protein, partial [Simkaniaceae bacterium]|nr:F-box protein [Simkaniaceae bacterium]